MTAVLALVFFANITFAHSIDFHLCQGELQSLAFFGEKASCSKMAEAEMAAPRSCCDVKKAITGLTFKQKSCCESIQVEQSNVLNKPNVESDQSIQVSFDFINDFGRLPETLETAYFPTRSVDIPPPPNIDYRITQENLQVFII